MRLSVPSCLAAATRAVIPPQAEISTAVAQHDAEDRADAALDVLTGPKAAIRVSALTTTPAEANRDQGDPDRFFMKTPSEIHERVAGPAELAGGIVPYGLVTRT